jgi:hypothetical protein
MRKRLASVAMASMMICFVAGCGEDESPVGTPQGPQVTNTYPQTEATDVNLNPLIQVWFDQAIDPASLDTNTFFVKRATTHHIDYDAEEHRAMLCLASILEADRACTVNVKATVINTDGVAMGHDFQFDFATGPLDCDHLADYLEPNDDVDAAAELKVNTVYTVLGACGPAERDDFYTFTLSQPAKVTARVSCSYTDSSRVPWIIEFGRDADHRYYLYQSALLQLGSIDTDFSFLPGTYYVMTGKWAADESHVVYDLILETSPPCPDDSYEDNDFLDQAASISAGTIDSLGGCYLDMDFFSIEMTTGQTLDVTLTERTATSEMHLLRILNADGGMLTGHMNYDNPASETWMVTDDGTYYIMIFWWADGIIYDLDVQVTD